MSIPKEPRQLLINLMYIVLTALLALNVSAEIVNAFFSMDKSIQESTQIVQSTNAKLLASLEAQAEAYSQYQPLQEKALKAQEIAQDFHLYVDKLREELITASGGLDKHDIPKGKLDKNTTTRLLVKNGRGDELEQAIEETRTKLLTLLEDPDERSQLETKIPLKVQEIPSDSDKKSWAQFTFQQMPVAAILPMFSKLQNDVKIAETALLNYFLDKTNNTIKPDSYIPIMAAQKNYITKGEEFVAEIFLGAYSSTADNIFMEVNGKRLRVNNGKASFKATANSLGKQRNKVVIGMTDPVTGETERFTKTFEYEVGQKSITVSADKMNVLYLGVDNPISISAAGVSSGDVRIKGKNLELEGPPRRLIARPMALGKATIIVQTGGLPAVEKEFRVKRIPDPILKLGKKTGGTISASEFKVHKGIIPYLENFDFDAKCEVIGFNLTRQPRNDDVREETNKGGRYKGAVKRLVQEAKITDVYYFDNIKVRCPGDKASRSLNGMIFKIK